MKGALPPTWARMRRPWRSSYRPSRRRGTRLARIWRWRWIRGQRVLRGRPVRDEGRDAGPAVQRGYDPVLRGSRPALSDRLDRGRTEREGLEGLEDVHRAAGASSATRWRRHLRDQPGDLREGDCGGHWELDPHQVEPDRHADGTPGDDRDGEAGGLHGRRFPPVRRD